MSNRLCRCLAALLCAFCFIPNLVGVTVDARVPHPAALFIENRGQSHPTVRFASHGLGVPIFFTERDVRLVLGRHGTHAAIALELIDARAARIEGRGATGAHVNFLRAGAVPLQLRAFREVVYRDVWPGIDAIFREESGRLTYEFLLRPGARVADIRLRYAGVEPLTLTSAGDLTIATPVGRLVDTAPLTFQTDRGRRTTIDSRFVLHSDTEFGFEVGAYDRDQPLLIDPSLVYSTLLGGGDGSTQGQAIAVDNIGASYVAGSATSPELPLTPGVVDTTQANEEGFVAKLTPDGAAFEYVTYLGGSGHDEVHAVAIDIGGNAYLAGRTTSSDFPVTPGAWRTTKGGAGTDGFVAKLDPQGATLAYATYIDGDGASTWAADIALDGAGQAHVVGQIEGATLPTTPNAFRHTASGIEGFLIKFNATGDGVLYASYIGGSELDRADDIALDPSGNVYLTGWTTSPDFQTTAGAYQRTFGAAGSGGFAVKVNPAAADASRALIYSTLLGTLGEVADDLAVDPITHAAYIASWGPFRSNTTQAPMLLKLNSSGSALAFRQQVGPQRFDSRIASIAIDGDGRVYVGGLYDDTVMDGFISRIDSQGLEASRLTLAYREHDGVYAIAADNAGAVYATGRTNSPDFPVSSEAPQSTVAGEWDAIVLKASFDDVAAINVAEDRTATSSSVEASHYAASAAFDGDLSTRWSSQFSDPQWIAVDLGERYHVTRVALHWETAYGAEYELHISDDGVNWYPLDARNGGFSTDLPGNGDVDNHIDLNGTGRYVRMYGLERATQWGYSLWEMQVFGTPVSSPAPAPGTVNLARGADVAVSTVERAGLGGANAVDGNMATRWSSEFADPQWLMVDLGGHVTDISRVVLRWEAAYGRDYQIQVSDDLSSWQTIASVTGGNGGVDDLTALNGAGRYVRMHGTARGTPWGYSLWEFEVYGVIRDDEGAPPPDAADDVVLYASEASSTTGWTFVDDPSAAGGRKLTTPDNNWASPNAPPPAGTAPTASFTVDVPAAGDYRLWMRLQGLNNSKFNESVWVQFSNATRNGAPVYRWSTSDALLVNLEDCSGCGIAGWGWQDNAWWLNQSSLVTLPAGTQTIYVTVREDGVQFDQIVLSPERYLNAGPGPVKNDTTIVPQDGPQPPPTSNSEVVLYASDHAALYQLTIDEDPTAAEGKKITSIDEGRAWTDRPPAPNDAPYAVFPFETPEGGDYRVWLRLKAQGNTKWNDSVWVQFSNATRGGAPVYRWGSSDGLLVNLENCSNCGVQDWGWQDNSWWLNQSSLVTLDAGPQFIYVTLREDGVEFDQIVISRERYATSAPGPVTNDSTIVARSAENLAHVTSGTFEWGPLSSGQHYGQIDYVGEDGFSLQGRVFPDTGDASIFGSQCSAGCTPGSRQELHASWTSGDILGGHATYRGQTYTGVGSQSTRNSAHVQLAGFVTMPAAGSEPVTIVVPFTARGMLFYEDGIATPHVNYAGGGQATFTLVYETVDNTWKVEHAVLDFAR